jgi:hypothetical protein
LGGGSDAQAQLPEHAGGDAGVALSAGQVEGRRQGLHDGIGPSVDLYAVDADLVGLDVAEGGLDLLAGGNNAMSLYGEAAFHRANFRSGEGASPAPPGVREVGMGFP